MGAEPKYAVLFDCDGVLVNSEEVASEYDCRYFAEEYGLHYTRKQFVAMTTGITYELFVQKIDEEHRRVHGRGLPDDFSEKLMAHYKRVMIARMRQIPEVGKLLRALKSAGILYAVFSNGQREGTEWKLEHVGLRHYFGRHVYGKDMVPRPKPFPDGYLHAARELGVPPENCFVIEDSPTGVRAGVAAGMHVIGYTGGGHRDEDYDKVLRAAGARFTNGSMNHIGTYILNRAHSYHRRFGGPRP